MAEKINIDQAKEALSAQGFKIRTAEEEESFLDNIRKESEGKGYSAFANLSDKAISEISGLQKEPSEKSTDYAKRVFEGLSKEKQTLSQKLQELKEKGIEGNTVVEEYKGQIEALKEKLKQANQTWEEKMNSYKSEVFKSKVNSDISAIISREIDPKLNKDIPPAILSEAVENRKASFLSKYTPVEVEGTLIWKDANGNTVTSDQDGHPLTASELLAGHYKDMFATQQQQNGAGSNGAQGKGVQQKSTGIPAEIDSQTKLYEYMEQTLGLDPKSKEFAEMWSEHAPKMQKVNQYAKK